MANIFRSKDVFKRAPGIPSSEDPLRKVSGVYVVGDYKPPYYINSGIEITGINTTKATVVDYTERSVDASDCFTVGVLNFDISDFEIDTYTQASANASDCFTVGVLGFDISDLDVLQYQTKKEDTSDCFTVGVLNFDISDFDIIQYSRIEHNTTPEPMLRIKSIITNKATIVDA